MDSCRHECPRLGEGLRRRVARPKTAYQHGYHHVGSYLHGRQTTPHCRRADYCRRARPKTAYHHMPDRYVDSNRHAHPNRHADYYRRDRRQNQCADYYRCVPYNRYAGCHCRRVELVVNQHVGA